MVRMVRSLTKLALSLALALVPSVAAASLAVTISVTTTTTINGVTTTTTTTEDASTLPPGSNFVLSSPVTLPTTTLFLLNCGAPPCTVFFPSGLTSPQPDDTLKFQDRSSTSRARVILTQSGSTTDIVLTDANISSVFPSGTTATATITYGTAPGDLGAISPGGTYLNGAVLSGTFQTSSGAPASACTLALSSPCVEASLQVQIDPVTFVGVNGVGSNVSPFVTLSVPCDNTSPDAPCAPPGISGSYFPFNGAFIGVSDIGSISCGDSITPCTPGQQVTLVATYNGANETLRLSGSSAAATSFVGEQSPDSFIGLISALEAELGSNLFVLFTSANGAYQVSPEPPLTNQTRNIGDSSTLPLSFDLLRGTYQPVSTTALVSIGCDDPTTPPSLSCPTSPPAPPSSVTANDGAYVAFIPSSLKFKDVTTLVATYDEKLGTAFSGDPRLGNVLFSDCSAGSFRIDIELVDPSTNAFVGTVHVYMGANASDHFRSGCESAEVSLSGSNLAANGDARVDTTGVGGSCCVTFHNSQTGTMGKLIVRAITVVVDQGVGSGAPTGLNYQIDLLPTPGPAMMVNGFSATNSLGSVTNFQQISALPVTGTFMRITKLSVPAGTPGGCTGLNGEFCPTIVYVVPNAAISTNGNKFSASVDVNSLFPVPGGTTYSVEMCLFGGPALPTPPSSSTQAALLSYFKSFQGTCPATVGIVTLK